MRIGVYGDSFANQPHHDMNMHWSMLLKNLLKAEVVDNHGVSGSSIYYSYKKFLDTYTKNDYNIFVVSQPNRYYKHVKLPTMMDNTYHLGGVYNIEKSIKQHQHNPNCANDIDTLLKIKTWVEATDDEYANDFADLMLEKMHNLDSNIILISGFEPGKYIKNKYGSNNLTDYLSAFIHYLDTNQEEPVWFYKYTERKNKIAGHFNIEYNIAIAKLIKNKIETNIFDWSILDNVRPTGKTEDYYEKIEQQ
jgi:hypothetical protein